MPKKKNSVALFEVMQKTGEKRRGIGLGAPVSAGRQPAAVIREPDPLQSVLPRPTGIANGRFGAPRKPVIYREAGRMNFSLSWVTGSAAALGLLVVLGLVFLLGRWTAPTGSQAARAGLPGALESAGEPGKSRWGSDPEWKKDKYYLVIQRMVGGADANNYVTDKALHKEALEVADWCTRRGYPAGVAAWNKEIIVWSKTGFNAYRDAEAQTYAREVHDLGHDEYLKISRRWNFSQKRHDGVFDPTFLRGLK